MSKKKVVEVVVVSFSTYSDMDFILPSKFCFRDGCGDMVFIKTRDRTVALEYIKTEYDGRYSLRGL
jgi:hypothetical protein